MKAWMKICLTVGLSCLLLGGAAGAAGFLMGGSRIVLSMDGFRFHTLDTRDRKTDGETLAPFDSMDIQVDSGALVLRSEGDRYAIDLEYPAGTSIDYAVEDGLLTVKAKQGVRLFWFGIGLSQNALECKVTVTVPEGKRLREVKADSDLGALTVSGLSAGFAELSASLGDMSLTGSSIDTLHMTADLGKLTLQDSTAQKMELNANMGSIEATGLVVREKLTFDCDMGSASFQGDLAGISGKCGMGSVSIQTSQAADRYRYELDCDMGSILLDDQKHGGSYIAGQANAPYVMELDCSMGSITVETGR